MMALSNVKSYFVFSMSTFYMAAQVRVLQSLHHIPSHACWSTLYGVNKSRAVYIEQLFGIPFMFADSIHLGIRATCLNLAERVGPKKLRSFGVVDIA
jgi:hypothetical protein